MKTIKILLLLLAIPFFGISQTTIFTENFGTPGATTSVATYTGFQNYGVQTYTGNADVRTTANSVSCNPGGTTACYVGASGSGNLFITSTLNTNLIISGINTTNYNTLSLSLGVLKTTNASNGSELGIQVSADGVTWTNLTFTMATGGNTANWTSVTPTGTIPSTANLRIRFIMKTVVTGLQFRVDDIKLTGIQNIILPIELGSFTVQRKTDKNILNWVTYVELNVDKFVIMKSLNGFDWNNIGEVKAKGNTIFNESYSYTDNVEGDYNYYRLFIYDNDGSYVMSKVIAIKNTNELTAPTKLYNILGQEILYGTGIRITK